MNASSNGLLGLQIGLRYEVFRSLLARLKAVLPVQQHLAGALGGFEADFEKGVRHGTNGRQAKQAGTSL
jgi:hypothetical protein